MGDTNLAVNFFVALFALIDPVGNIPLFAAATVGIAAGPRRRLAIYIALFAFGFLTLFYFAGVGVLQYFGISMPAFRIAGGLMLFMLGLDMARDDFTTRLEPEAGPGEPEASTHPARYARKHFERLIVPFGTPLLIGPGAISTVVIYAEATARQGWSGRAAGIAAIAGVSLAVMIAFVLSSLISRALGKIGMTIVVRVLGLILCALAVQFIMAGLADATIGIIRLKAAHPY
jgi:multiple antibiotic resistance protein